MKVRIDQLMVDQGLSESRERAKRTIMAGLVYIAEVRIDKPGQTVDANSIVTVRGDPVGFVSRGGLKLKKALTTFEIDVTGLNVIDVGASTGGFTDCLLKSGANHVWAVDVGYGQLAWSLRNDPRVTVFERTNIRHLSFDSIGQKLDMATIDVSFISLKLVLPQVRTLLTDDFKIVCLIKPQFEAGREFVGKKGVVRSPEIHEQVLNDFMKNALASGFSVSNLSYSPIKGPEGNIEYLAFLRPAGENTAPPINLIVGDAHKCL